MTVRGRAAALVGGGLVVVVGGLIFAAQPRPQGADAASPPAVATASVERTTLNATTQVDGTLGYAGSYTVTNELATDGAATDPTSAQQAYAQALVQYHAALDSRNALRHPTAGDRAQATAQLAQARAAVTQASTALSSDRAILTAARQALAACRAESAAGGHACDASALSLAVTQAQGRVSADSAQLSAALAASASAQTSLSALLHPSAAQLQHQDDAVAAAKAALDATAARLGQPRGVLTRLPDAGSTVQPGGTLYTLDGTVPVVLMTGSTPAWRPLGLGVADGADVEELESNLHALGFGGPDLTVDGRWDAATTAAVRAWQQAAGLASTGSVPLGQVVFEPGALRVTATSASLGSTVQPGEAILQATSTTPNIAVQLDPALQTHVKQGDPVTVTLPDGSTTPGTVSSVGTVATVPSGGGANPNTPPTPTISVTAALTDPAAAGGLDQAPVTVNITTATAVDVLAVPVSSLVALLEGGYAVQVDDSGQLRYVGVRLGLFANGLVEVSGTGLAEGQKVVVAQ
jgi:peptidoglycan hydrolase-like protein with peptidoglycan-binding domain